MEVLEGSRGIEVWARSLKDSNLKGQVGVNVRRLYRSNIARYQKQIQNLRTHRTSNTGFYCCLYCFILVLYVNNYLVL